MRILCNSISGRNLPEHARVMGETAETDFSPLKKGIIYPVYGMMFYATRIDFLVCPKSAEPMWVPANIFDLIDDHIPSKWACRITEKAEGYKELFKLFGIISICGYEKLTHSYSHYLGILERNPDELCYFHSNIKNHAE